MGNHDDVTDEFSSSKNARFAFLGDLNRLIGVQQKRESFLEREASNDPRNFVRFCAEKWPTHSLAVHALSENQD